MTEQIEKLNDAAGNQSLKIDFLKLLEKLLQNLNERGRQVIIGRFNLDGKGFRTLEEIGHECGITRERIRQIQVESIRKLKSAAKLNKEFGFVIDSFIAVLKKHGGAMDEGYLIDVLFDTNINIGGKKIEFLGSGSISRNILTLVLDINDKLVRNDEKENIRKFWALSAADNELVFRVISATKNIFEKKRLLMDYEAIAEEIRLEDDLKGKDININLLKSYLSISKELLKNPFGLWGMTEWEDVNPKGVRGKIYLILRNSGKPLHFIEITKLINETNWVDRKERKLKKIARSETVHNELIKDKRFVLVGRGTYALKEWGYNPGTVLDVITRILSEKGPVTKEDIVKEVLKERFVKVNTIIFNLHNSGFFEKNGELYRIKSENANQALAKKEGV